MREAIASPDPVVFLEPKKLYWSKDEVDLDEAQPGIGRPSYAVRAPTRP